jgi:hypothetical protein
MSQREYMEKVRKVRVTITHEFRPRWPWRIYILDTSSGGELYPRWEAGAFSSYDEAESYAKERGWEIWYL